VLDAVLTAAHVEHMRHALAVRHRHSATEK
jgi:hypothetical protein